VRTSSGEPDLELPSPESEPTLPTSYPTLSRTLKAFREPGVDGDWFQWLSELMVQMAEATDAPLVAEYNLLQPSSLILQDWRVIARAHRKTGTGPSRFSRRLAIGLS